MVLPDPRTGGGCIKCLSNKVVCLVAGWVQVVVWVIETITLIFSPSSVNLMASQMNTLQHVLSVLIGLGCIAFCLTFVYGVHKDRKLLIKIYLIYVVSFMILVIVWFIVNMCTIPNLIDFKYVFSVIFTVGSMVAGHILCLFIARGYYLMTYCNYNQQTDKNQVTV